MGSKFSPKPIHWVASSRKDLKKLPSRVQDDLGYALFLAQIGKRADSAKVLKGFGSAGVVELVEQLAGNTYRAVYTVKFKQVVYVLHVFQKKSKSGIATPHKDVELIKQRLKVAQEDYKKVRKP